MGAWDRGGRGKLKQRRCCGGAFSLRDVLEEHGFKQFCHKFGLEQHPRAGRFWQQLHNHELWANRDFYTHGSERSAAESKGKFDEPDKEGNSGPVLVLVRELS